VGDLETQRTMGRRGKKWEYDGFEGKVECQGVGGAGIGGQNAERWETMKWGVGREKKNHLVKTVMARGLWGGQAFRVKDQSLGKGKKVSARRGKTEKEGLGRKRLINIWGVCVWWEPADNIRGKVLGLKGLKQGILKSE